MIEKMNYNFYAAITAPAIGVLLFASGIMPALACGQATESVPILRIRGTDYSTNWSGYAAESSLASPSSGFVKNVKGDWIVPTLSCPSTGNTYSSVWVGIDGFDSSTVEQLGTESDCSNGVQKNYAWYEMYPKPAYLVSRMTISPGDHMTASVNYIGKNQFTLTMKDLTTGKSFSSTFKSGNADRSSAEWVIEAPWSGGVLPLANFGTTQITNAYYTTSDNVSHSIDGLGSGTYTDIVMNNPSGASATPSALGDGGSSFTVTYSQS